MRPPTGSLRLVFTVAIAVVLGGVGFGRSRQTPALPEASPAIEEAVRAVLERFPDRRHIPELRLVAAAEAIPLVAEARTFTWTDRVLPTDGGRPFRLTTRAALQGAADAERTNQYYAFVQDDRLTSDLATLWVGVAFARPSDRRGAVECCCSWQVQFRRTGTRWVPVESEESVSRCY